MTYNDHHGKKPPMKTDALKKQLTAENFWRYQQETRQFSAAFYGHVWGCLHCFPWRNEYCETGRHLRHDYFSASQNAYNAILAAQNEK